MERQWCMRTTIKTAVRVKRGKKKKKGGGEQAKKKRKEKLATWHVIIRKAN